LSYRPLFLGPLAAAGLRRYRPADKAALRRILLGFFVRVMGFAVTAVLFELKTLGVVLLVFLRVIVAPLALCACHHDYHAVFFFRHRYRP
jgi:hypothetical protein